MLASAAPTAVGASSEYPTLEPGKPSRRPEDLATLMNPIAYFPVAHSKEH